MTDTKVQDFTDECWSCGKVLDTTVDPVIQIFVIHKGKAAHPHQSCLDCYKNKPPYNLDWIFIEPDIWSSTN